MASQAEPGWCRTTLGDTAEATFRWTIHDFKKCPEKFQEKLESACFNVNGPGDLKSKWNLEIYPRGLTPEAKEDYVGMYLCNKGKAKVMAKYKLDVIDCTGNKRELVKVEFGPIEFESSGGSYSNRGKHKWLKREELDAQPDLLPDGHLAIQCTVTVFGPQKILLGSDVSTNSNLLVDCKNKVVEDPGRVFFDKEFTDIKIQCEGQSFDCHMVILAARSPVFKAMFQSDMKETQTQKVTIDDFKAEVVGEMLNFIYTGNVSSQDAILDIASELLKVADKYQLDLLKNICEESLCSTLKVINCVEYLVLGDMYNAVKLKKIAMRLVVQNADSISNTDVFREFFKQKPELALEFTNALNKK